MDLQGFDKIRKYAILFKNVENDKTIKYSINTQDILDRFGRKRCQKKRKIISCVMQYCLLKIQRFQCETRRLMFGHYIAMK